MRAGWLILPTVLVALLMAGALGAPFQRDEVPFEKVERDHFDAIAVNPEKGVPTTGPIDLRVHVVGDGADADISPALDWLAQHANIRVTRSDGGAPLFLTRGDLSATSGRATLGATVTSGVAAEINDPRIDECVVAHEILHLLGLGHVDDPNNIMYPHCFPGMLGYAKIEPWQVAQLDALKDISATTPRGVETWVTRG